MKILVVYFSLSSFVFLDFLFYDKGCGRLLSDMWACIFYPPSILGKHQFSLIHAAQSFENQIQSYRENIIKMETSCSLLSVLVLGPVLLLSVKISNYIACVAINFQRLCLYFHHSVWVLASGRSVRMERVCSLLHCRKERKNWKSRTYSKFEFILKQDSF